MSGDIVFGGPLSERKKRILRSIIDAHIAMGEPIGSKYLVTSAEIPFSSATIRNEMAELEEMGYLEQPHTSAGRVPSELGYRFYVDSLLERYRTTTDEIDRLNISLQARLTELDNILNEASRLASSLTNYAAIAARPRGIGACVSRFESVYLNEKNFVLIIMLEDGRICNRTIRLASSVTEDELRRLTSAFNLMLTGRTSSEINLSMIYEIERMMGRAAAIVDPLVKVVYDAISDTGEGELSVEGVNRLLEYPEFSDAKQFRSILSAIEEKTPILNMIPHTPDDDVHVYIGSETALDVMSNSTVIVRQIRQGDNVLGTIGIIGPRRMDYSRVIAILDLLANGISGMLSGGPAPNLLKGPDNEE